MKTKIQNNCFLIHYNVMIYENRTQFVVAIYTYIYIYIYIILYLMSASTAVVLCKSKIILFKIT